MTVATDFVSEQAVRDLIELNGASASAYSADTIGSNIRSAFSFLSRATGRTLVDVTATRKFTTEGRASMPLPGLRTATSVVLNGATLAADTTYWLLPDAQQTGIYTGIQFRAFRTGRSDGPIYLSNPEWFDRNLDTEYRLGRYTATSSLPNDLVIAGAWGYTDALLPDIVRDTGKILAAFKTLRPAALLSGARSTEGGIFDMSQYPIEVQSFVEAWKGGEIAVGVG